jgi:ABC-type transport system involved in cytochrome bd biosynthesis fused ATPase/permease subunit
MYKTGIFSYCLTSTSAFYLFCVSGWVIGKDLLKADCFPTLQLRLLVQLYI